MSKKHSDKSLHILADVKKEVKKTKEFSKFLQKNKLANVLIISDSDSMKNINKSARNIKNVKLRTSFLKPKYGDASGVRGAAWL